MYAAVYRKIVTDDSIQKGKIWKRVEMIGYTVLFFTFDMIYIGFNNALKII